MLLRNWPAPLIVVVSAEKAILKEMLGWEVL